jgi:hypothetical protein
MVNVPAPIDLPSIAGRSTGGVLLQIVLCDYFI